MLEQGSLCPERSLQHFRQGTERLPSLGKHGIDFDDKSWATTGFPPVANELMEINDQY